MDEPAIAAPVAETKADAAPKVMSVAEMAAQLAQARTASWQKTGETGCCGEGRYEAGAVPLMVAVGGAGQALEPDERRNERRRSETRCLRFRPQPHSQKLIAAGPRMTTNSTGRKNRIIGTVSLGGSDAAFFSASDWRMSRFSLAMTRSA